VSGKMKTICKICGVAIKKVKGAHQIPQREVDNEVHDGCMRKKTHEIMQSHRISGSDYLQALIDGLFELFPELNETTSMTDYRSRERKAKLELEETFPFLKAQEQEQKENGG